MRQHNEQISTKKVDKKESRNELQRENIRFSEHFRRSIDLNKEIIRFYFVFQYSIMNASNKQSS